MAGKGNIDQYLTFTLDREQYAVSVKKVREVLELVPITRVPRMPEFMKGVLNLRGAVVPVVDLRLRFGLEENEVTKDTSIIIMEINSEDGMVLLGAFTDSVQEVIEIDTSEIEPPPRMGLKLDIDFISGMYQRDEQFIILLDMDKVLNTDELLQLPKSGDLVPSAEEEKASEEGSDAEED